MVAAAGNKPERIEEYVGRVRSGTEAVSVARMQSPGGWVEPGQTPEFDEYTVDAYYNRRGELRCLVPRKRVEVRGGEISKGVALKGATYDYLLQRLRLVTGARGCLTFQFFASRTTSRLVAIELNPRFGGGYPLSYAAGANYPDWLIREYLLEEEIPAFDGWRDRTAMVRYDDEIVFMLPDPT